MNTFYSLLLSAIVAGLVVETGNTLINHINADIRPVYEAHQAQIDELQDEANRALGMPAQAPDLQAYTEAAHQATQERIDAITKQTEVTP